MKLYYAPGVCSIGIHVLLEEIGKPYELELVNAFRGAGRTDQTFDLMLLGVGEDAHIASIFPGSPAKPSIS